ncbi:hypothetical protein KCU65_g2977, partial [Aureobasidium melanogenum]
MMEATDTAGVTETQSVAETQNATETGNAAEIQSATETENVAKNQTQHITDLQAAAKDLDSERLEELRWYSYAMQVIYSNFYVGDGKSADSWMERLLYPAQTKNPDCSLDIVISKMQTAVEANHRKTPVTYRISYIIWLGLLTRDWAEAEVLKWVANQEYLLYLYRGHEHDTVIALWLDRLGMVTEVRTPSEVRQDLLVRLKALEKSFADRFRDVELRRLIAQPHIYLHDPTFLSNELLHTRAETTRNSVFERESRLHLQQLEEEKTLLTRALSLYGARIVVRQRDIDDYTGKVNAMIKSSLHEKNAACKISDLDLKTMLGIIKVARTGEKSDKEIWLRLDTCRQSVRITIGRLQKLLILEKKKNHNKNKNKNRAKKRKMLKELQQNESEGSEASIDEVTEEENEEDDLKSEEDWEADEGAEENGEGPSLPQGGVSSALAGVTKVQMLEDLERALLKWSGALKT